MPNGAAHSGPAPVDVRRRRARRPHFWWTTLAAAHIPRLQLVALLSLFTTMLHTGALGALLTFSQSVWYPVYGERAHDCALTAIEDQQPGGLVMWIPGGTAYLLAALFVLAGALTQPRAAVPQ